MSDGVGGESSSRILKVDTVNVTYTMCLFIVNCLMSTWHDCNGSSANDNLTFLQCNILPLYLMATIVVHIDNDPEMKVPGSHMLNLDADANTPRVH